MTTVDELVESTNKPYREKLLELYDRLDDLTQEFILDSYERGFLAGLITKELLKEEK